MIEIKIVIDTENAYFEDDWEQPSEEAIRETILKAAKKALELLENGFDKNTNLFDGNGNKCGSIRAKRI